MNLDGSPGRLGRQNVNPRRATRTTSPTSPAVSPDRDVDWRRRFEALKGDLTAVKPNANSPGGDGLGQKVPLTLADIQGSIAKKHTTDLANAQRKWIESLNLQTPVDSGPSEEEAQKEWINHISVSRVSDRQNRRDDGQRRRSDRAVSSEHRVTVPSPRSSGATSPQKVQRNLTVRSTFLTPAAPSFGFCDVPHLTINSLPVTATSVKDVVKPDKEFVTESGKTIKMLKLEEPPRAEKKFKGRSPQKMKAVIDLDPSKNEDKPKWVGPLENPSAPSVLESSFEFTVPQPKTPVLSNDVTGTITFKRSKDPKPGAESKTPTDSLRGDAPIQPATGVSILTDLDPQLDASSADPAFRDLCLKDLEVSTDELLPLKRPSPLSVESATQVDLVAEKSTPIKTKSVAISTHNSSKRPKQNLSEERLVNKENLQTHAVNPLGHYSSKFDKFLAEYVPTPKKGEGSEKRPETPPWLREMSQYPDQFNLINTLNKAYRRQQKLESSETHCSKETSLSSSLPGSSKIHEKGCAQVTSVSQDLFSTRSELAQSNSSSRISDKFLLEAPAVKLTDRSSSILSTSANSFEALAPNVDNFDLKLSTPSTPRLSLVDMNSTDLNFLFPPKIDESRESALTESLRSSCGEFLGEKVPMPKGLITERKPLKRRSKLLSEKLKQNLGETSVNPLPEFVNTKRGSDIDEHLNAKSSPDIGHSRSTSFSSIKEGSYVLTHSETKSDDSAKAFDMAQELGLPKLARLIPQSALSEHSSDSMSEIVKVSRTVSRGSTVISEEVSEVQNTVSVSKMKFNSSSIQTKIRNEIEQLDRVDESLTSFMESSKIKLSREKGLPSRNQSELTLEPTSQDLVTVRRKTPPHADDDLDSTLFTIPRSAIHSRDPSNSSLDLSAASMSGADITKFSVEVFDNLIKDEKMRSDKLLSGLKTNLKNLCSKAKKELESMESQKKSLIETGHEEEARELKRKQRGYIMKLNEDVEDIHKQRALEIKACQERCTLLKQQQQIIKLLLQNRRHSTVRNSRGSQKSLQSTQSREFSLVQLDESLKYMGNERNADLIDRKRREFREKEEALRERKKNVEAIVAWKKRLDSEEKSVRELEKLIAQSTFSAPLPEITSSAVERGTSPFTVAKDEEENAPESRMRIATTSQSESDHQNKDYYSDSFEHSSALSEAAGSALPCPGQSSTLLNKAMRIPMLKVPLSPRVTIIKRRHSSGSDESMLLSQNDTLSEPSDVEVRVSALEQQLRHRKSELAKLKREYQKNQKERLRSTEKNLINQIQLYDSYIEQVKNEIKDLENSDVKVTKPQIKQPKFSDRRSSDKFLSLTKSKESQDATDAKNNETTASEDMSSHDASVLFLDKPQERKLPETQKAECESEKLDVQEQIVSELDFEPLSNVDVSGFMTDPALKTAMEKVKMKAMEPSKDSESSTSEKDFSIEEIIERAEQSKMDSSDEIHTQSNVLTEPSMTEIASDHKSKLSVLEELTETPSQISEVLPAEACDTVSSVPSVVEEITEHIESVKELEKQDSLSVQLPEVLSPSRNSTPEAMPNDKVSDLKDASCSEVKSELNTTFEIIKNKSPESDASKMLSEEISEHLVQSKTSSNETVINTVSESQKPFVPKVHEANGSTISEKLSIDVEMGSRMASEQIEELASSPENVTGTHSLALESLSPASSPHKSVENGSEQVSEQISVSGKISEVRSVQSESEPVASEMQEAASEPKSGSSFSGTIQEEFSGSAARESPPVEDSVSPESAVLSQEKPVSGATASNSRIPRSKSARKRLDLGMDEGSKGTIEEESKFGYEPTMKTEGGKRSISELIHSETISEASSISEQIPTDRSGSGVVEESVTEKSVGSEGLEQVGEEIETEKSDDSALEKLDFSLGSLAGYKMAVRRSPSQTEAGDNVNVSHSSEIPEDKEELGQGDEPIREIDQGEIEADSLEDLEFNKMAGWEKALYGSGTAEAKTATELSPDGFKGFDTSYDPEEFNRFTLNLPSFSFDEQSPEVTPQKPSKTVMEKLDQLWEKEMALMEAKSSEETPLLSALQRESQQNFNADTISMLIYDSFVDDATSAALMAYAKKKQSSPASSPANAKSLDTPENVGDNEKLWLGEDFTLPAVQLSEAEQLRLQQLQIEQEIEQLEQAQEVVPSYYYVREIPNKPPPPYTPPKPAPPSKEETVSRVLQGGEILWDLEMTGGDPIAAEMPSSYLSALQDEPYRMFLFDLAKELYLKVKPKPSEPAPPWVVSKPRGKPLPPVRCKEDLLKHMEKEVKLAFGFEPRILRESLIMKWTRKRRDHVDEILVRQLQESEAEWRDFTVEENIIKNRVAESIMADTLDEASHALELAFTRKFSNHLNGPAGMAPSD